MYRNVHIHVIMLFGRIGYSLTTIRRPISVPIELSDQLSGYL